MSQVKAKQALASHYQVVVSKNNYEDVRAEVGSYEETDIEELITSDNYDAPYDCYLKCTLFHVKKKKEQVVKFDSKKKDNKVEALYYRFMFLADEKLNPIALIVDNNSLKSHVMAFSSKMKLGYIMHIINPTFEGYFNNMPLLKCEGIFPTSETTSFRNTIKVNETSDEKYIFACFTTDKFKLKKIKKSDGPCKGACDSRYGRLCYCMKQQNIPGDVLGFHFVVKDYSSLVFEVMPSLNLTKMLTEDEVIDSSFEDNKKVCLRDICKHANAELQDKSATFFVWFKPVKKEESDTFYLSKGNITRVVINGTDVAKYQFPRLRVEDYSAAYSARDSSALNSAGAGGNDTATQGSEGKRQRTA